MPELTPLETMKPENRTAARLETRARKLWNLRLADPKAPQYALADSLWGKAQELRKTAKP
jgi:hypothetical protein